MKKKVSILGLGRIGLPTALISKRAGYDVIGVDPDPQVLKNIKEKKHLIEEPGIAALYQEVEIALCHTSKQSEIYLIAVPTPLTREKKSDLSALYQALESILPFAKNHPLVIIESTCPIGTTEKLKQKFPYLIFAYCPERVLPGNLLHELINNDRVIGGTCEVSSQKAKAFYQIFVQGKIWETDASTAEAVKLVENAYRDLNIAFANELSMLSDELHLSYQEIIRLANHHPRVNILNPGPGVGGHCIGVDPYFLMEALKNGPSVITAARKVNERKKDWVLNKIRETAREKKCQRILCLGATYKANVSDFRESPALAIALSLNKDFIVDIIDPFYGEKIDIPKQIKKSDMVVGLVAHQSFKELSSPLFVGKVILDFAGVFS